MQQLLARLVKDFAERQWNQIQMRGKSLEVWRGQRAEETILIRTVGYWHR
jgi:hypothetical protein